MLIKEAQTIFKNITGMDAFVDKEQWNMIRMKEFHAKFVVIFSIKIPNFFY
jgi:hypothetical protein